MADNNIIREAKKTLSAGYKKENKNYLDSGYHCDAYKFEFEKKPHVVKYYHHKSNITDLNDSELHLELYQKASNIEFVAQLIDSSTENRILITQYIAGELLSKLNVLSKDHTYLPSAIRHLILTFQDLDNNGLRFDPKRDNIKLYDDNFYVIDFLKKAGDIKIQKEVLSIPSILSHTLENLMLIIPIFMNELNKLQKLKSKSIKVANDWEFQLKSYETLHGEFITIKGLNEEDQNLNKYIQFLFHNDWNE